MSQAPAGTRRKSKERDPLARRIVEVLDAGVDPDLFERCVCHLLRDVFPGLVPISGGSDQGMDGAIADGDGEAYPLICTTAEDPVRNLKRSLESYGKSQEPREKAVFVTSRRLSPPARRKLEDTARKRGFWLVQIIDQDGVVDRLYRSALWKKELGVNTAAPALSRVPQSLRPSLGIPLIGRDEDVAWLDKNSGDRVLSGQPGSGKTHLLRHLVDQGWGLFLVSDDRTEVRNEILERRLDKSSELAVIVDDAHGNLDRIAMLRQLREELGGSFPIIATCWPGALEEVSNALGVGEASRRELQLLTRNQIVEVLAAAGVTEEFVSEHLLADPKIIIRHLVDQAANRPGLAVTLADWAIRGDWKETLTGQVLRRELGVLRRLVGADPVPALAAFALGGESGMPLPAVAAHLGITEPALQGQVINLAVGGVLHENRYQKTLTVIPRALRSVLLQGRFFRGGATDLSIQTIDALLDEAPSRDEAIQAILRSKEAGAILPGSWIRNEIKKSESALHWKHYAVHGREEAQWVLDNYWGNVIDVAPEALTHLSKKVIPLLLEGVEERAVDRAAGSERSFGILARWLSEDPDKVLERKDELAHAAIRLMKRSAAAATALKALFLAMSPTFTKTNFDPGMGNELSVTHHHAGLQHVKGLSRLWNLVQKELPSLQADWVPILHGGLWPWLHPGAGNLFDLPEATLEQMKEHGRRMLEDMADHSCGSVAVRSELDRLSRDIGAPLGLDLDEEYETLFAERSSSETWQDARATEEKAAAALADRWRTEESQDAAERLRGMIREAEKAGHSDQGRLALFASALASRVQDPVGWAWRLAEEGLPENVVEPFLREAEAAEKQGWDRVAEQVLQSKEGSGQVFRFVITRESPPPKLLALAIHKAPFFIHEIHYLRQSAPAQTMCRLLMSDDDLVAATAAAAEWEGSRAKPKAPRQEIAAEWRKAALRSHPEDASSRGHYWLMEAFELDRDLARDWLLRRIAEDLPGLPVGSHTYNFAARSLTEAQRIALLRHLDVVAEHPACRFLVIALVGRSTRAFEALLDRPALKADHLRPLGRQRPASLDESWVEMVRCAVGAEESPEKIAKFTVYGLGVVTIAGSGGRYWQDWVDGFARFTDDPRPDIRRVAEAGVAFATKSAEEANKKERQRELEGL